jgi:ATP-dependent DNA helicase RecQ
MPSRRRDDLIGHVARALGSLGNLPVVAALTDVAVVDPGAAGFQADQSNSAHQAGNVLDRFEVTMPEEAELRTGPVLLIDDEADSRWTITVAGHCLRRAGSGPVLPLTLRAR